MDTAAKNKYTRDLPRFRSSPGKSPGTKARRKMPKHQEMRMPVKNGGTAMQNWFRNVWSPSSFPLADNNPKGSDTTTISTKLTRLKHSVTSIFGPNSACTGWRYWKETPRFPVKKPASHSPYRTSMGRFNPISARRASTFSGVACVPSRVAAGSPEIISKAANVRRETTSMVTSSVRIFRAVYRMTVISLPGQRRQNVRCSSLISYSG